MSTVDGGPCGGGRDAIGATKSCVEEEILLVGMEVTANVSKEGLADTSGTFEMDTFALKRLVRSCEALD